MTEQEPIASKDEISVVVDGILIFFPSETQNFYRRHLTTLLQNRTQTQLDTLLAEFTRNIEQINDTLDDGERKRLQANFDNRIMGWERWQVDLLCDGFAMDQVGERENALRGYRGLIQGVLDNADATDEMNDELQALADRLMTDPDILESLFFGYDAESAGDMLEQLRFTMVLAAEGANGNRLETLDNFRRTVYPEAGDEESVEQETESLVSYEGEVGDGDNLPPPSTSPGAGENNKNHTL